jgi:hypothetical protein
VSDGRNNIKTWLFNPHYFIAGWQALVLGLIVILASAYVGSLSGNQFDGLLDIHFLPPAPLATLIEEAFFDWFIFAVLIYFGGRMVSGSHIRVLDVLGTQALSRFPSLISVTVLLFTKPGMMRYYQNPNHFGANIPDMATFWGGMIVVILMLAWMLQLMIQAFAVSCNVDLRGMKERAVFWGAVLLGEIITKEVFGRIYHIF